MDQMFEELITMKEELKALQEENNRLQVENALLRCRFSSIVRAILDKFGKLEWGKGFLVNPLNWIKAIQLIQEIIKILKEPCDEL